MHLFGCKNTKNVPRNPVLSSNLEWLGQKKDKQGGQREEWKKTMNEVRKEGMISQKDTREKGSINKINEKRKWYKGEKK